MNSRQPAHANGFRFRRPRRLLLLDVAAVLMSRSFLKPTKRGRRSGGVARTRCQRGGAITRYA